MLTRLKNERGSVLGIAMIYFLVFSITGMAILTLSAHARITIQDYVHTIRNQYAVESTLSEALWRLNSGPDSQANFVNGDVTSQYVDSTKTLMVSTNRWGKTQQIEVGLEEDHHFDRGVGFRDLLDTLQASVIELPGHVVRKFDFLPVLDTAYYAQNAVQVYDKNTNLVGTIPSGIHFARKNITLKNRMNLQGCLVVMGDLVIRDKKGSTIRAITDSAGVYIPALILGKPDGNFRPKDPITIEGAIFSYGKYEFNKGSVTGPIVAKEVKVKKNLDMNNPVNEKYYVWPPGFGDFNSYDWPKQIKTGTWKN